MPTEILTPDSQHAPTANQEQRESSIFRELWRREMSSQMAAMLLLALFAEQSKHLVAEAHQPETTGLSQRERWQKIIDEFATYRRETGDFSPKKQQTQWQRMGYNYSMPYSYNE